MEFLPDFTGKSFQMGQKRKFCFNKWVIFLKCFLLFFPRKKILVHVCSMGKLEIKNLTNHSLRLYNSQFFWLLQIPLMTRPFTAS